MFIAVVVMAMLPVLALGANVSGSRVMGSLPDGSLSGKPLPPLRLTDENGETHAWAMRTEVVEKIKDGKKRRVRVTFFEYTCTAPGEPTQTTQIGRWRDDDQHATTFSPLIAAARGDGEVFLLAQRTADNKNEHRQADVVLLRGGQLVGVVETNAIWGAARLLFDTNGQAIAFSRTFFNIRVHHRGTVATVATHSQYDWSVGRNSDGTICLFTYNNDTRAFWLHSARESVWRWTRRQLDSAEAGWQHSIASAGDTMVVLYYYYRNSFNKGLALVEVERGEVTRQWTWLRVSEHNAGWRPLLGVASSGEVSLSYLSSVQDGEVTKRDYQHLQELRAERIDSYFGQTTGDWTDNYSETFAIAGPEIGVGRQAVFTPAPVDDEEAADVVLSHEHRPGVIARASFEGRWGRLNLGISYARELIASKVDEALGARLRRAFEMFTGFVAFRDLFFGHDVAVQLNSGRFGGSYRDSRGVKRADSEINEVEIGLLNQWRTRYGVRAGHYRLRQPVYAYYSARGESEYEYLGGSVVDADFLRAVAFIASSSLDYVTKYENYFNGITWDFSGSIGVAYSDWEPFSLSTHEIARSFGLALGARAKVYYMYYRRLWSMRGGGFFARVGLDGAWRGAGVVPGAPSPRKHTNIDDAHLSVQAVNHRVFYGVFAGAGLVF